MTGQKGGGGKKSGLIGKLRKLTRGLSSEREFGSGSDISSASVQSAAVQQQQQRQQQQHRTSAAAKVTDDSTAFGHPCRLFFCTFVILESRLNALS